MRLEEDRMKSASLDLGERKSRRSMSEMPVRNSRALPGQLGIFTTVETNPSKICQSVKYVSFKIKLR